jgi:hypothetical protein
LGDRRRNVNGFIRVVYSGYFVGWVDTGEGERKIKYQKLKCKIVESLRDGVLWGVGSIRLRSGLRFAPVRVWETEDGGQILRQVRG